MNITYFGQSVLLIEHGQDAIIIDPFINGNPHTNIKVEDLKVNYIYVTHGHGDHLGDTVELAKQNNATVIAPVELATWISWQGVNVVPMHIGGEKEFSFGKLKLIEAIHGSSIVDEENKQIINVGPASGVLLKIAGKTIYHAGDTALFRGMKTLGEYEQIDLAYLPIGNHFTMGIDDAVIAAEWIDAKQVVPIHYNTFPAIQADPNEFLEKLIKKNGFVQEPNTTISLL
ncbi:metal-dependent hydrolase [Bacillus sp. OAE603]|uniref:metal-dependent hydrolase n=1 Tax=Gottfriedia sp. OAE603 TaxID=2663872 RepID=UPI00178A0BF0